MIEPFERRAEMCEYYAESKGVSSMMVNVIEADMQIIPCCGLGMAHDH
jgi:hypothetical protein